MVRLSRVLLVALSLGVLVISAVPASAASVPQDRVVMTPNGGHTQR